MNFTPLEGLIAAPFTPMHADGSINYEMIPVLVENLLRDGLVGAFVCGSNGEGPNMTLDERKRVAEAFVKASNGRLKIWVHVGHPCIEDARALFLHAYEIGADAGSAVASFYFKPQDLDTLVACMKAISEVELRLPFYFYHIPAITGLQVNVDEFIQKAMVAMPNFHGVKYTANTIWEYQNCVQKYGDKINVLYGYDEMLLPALAAGAKAAIGSTYNFAAPLYLKVVEAFRAGDLDTARERMNLLIEMVCEMVKFSPIPAQKAIMGILGNDVGGSRLPLNSLKEAEIATLRSRLQEIGFLSALNHV
jgi:N-acetylneuraminate lyase